MNGSARSICPFLIKDFFVMVVRIVYTIAPRLAGQTWQ
jgi:hypothetical protein